MTMDKFRIEVLVVFGEREWTSQVRDEVEMEMEVLRSYE